MIKILFEKKGCEWVASLGEGAFGGGIAFDRFKDFLYHIVRAADALNGNNQGLSDERPS